DSRHPLPVVVVAGGAAARVADLADAPARQVAVGDGSGVDGFAVRGSLLAGLRDSPAQLVIAVVDRLGGGRDRRQAAHAIAVLARLVVVVVDVLGIARIVDPDQTVEGVVLEAGGVGGTFVTLFNQVARGV